MPNTEARKADILKRIRECPPLPSLPAVAAMLLNDINWNSTSLPRLAGIIARDPAIMSKVLRAANSRLASAGQQITSLYHALLIFGVNETKKLVLGFSMVMTLRRRQLKGLDHIGYWRRSLLAASAARSLAQALPMPGDDCFLAAMMMDVGMLAMDAVIGEEYGKLTATVQNHQDLRAAEASAFGVTHMQAADELCRVWKLPRSLHIPMSQHHRADGVEDRGLRRIAEIIDVAGRIADALIESDHRSSASQTVMLCKERLGLDSGACGRVLESLRDAGDETRGLIDASLDPSLDYASMLERADRMIGRSDERDDDSSPAAEMLPSIANRSLHDERRSPRVSRKGHLLIYCRADGQMEKGTIVKFGDISTTGIAVRHGTPIRAGSQFLVGIGHGRQKPSVSLYTVVYCAGPDNGEFRIGAKLDHVVREHELDSDTGAYDSDTRRQIISVLRRQSA